MNALLIAAAAAPVVEPAAQAGESSGWSWSHVVAFLVGVVGYKVVAWVAGWFDGKGKDWISERFEKWQEQLNQNSVLGQIQADDAIMKIIRDAIPEVVIELTDTAKKDLKDGKLDKADWDDIGSRIWAKVKPIVEGGKNDYLTNSSFNDGKAAAAIIAEKFFKKQKAKEEGLVNE